MGIQFSFRSVFTKCGFQQEKYAWLMGLSSQQDKVRGKQEIKLEKRNKIKSIFRQNNILLTKIFESFSSSSKTEKHRFKILHENCHCQYFLGLEFSPSNKMGFYIKDEAVSWRSGLGPDCENHLECFPDEWKIFLKFWSIKQV